MWERALPSIRKMLAVGCKLVSPSVLSTIDSATRRKFPFGLGRQIFARPSGIGKRIRIRHMHDRMGVEAVNVTFPPVGMAPIRTPHKGPPLGPVPQIDGMLWWYENQRARKEQMRQSVWIVFGCRLLFRKCHVTGI